MRQLTTAGIRMGLFTVTLAMLAGVAGAHCDRVNGPVAQAAVNALESGDVRPAAIWVGSDQDKELRESFKRAQKAYREGGAARDLAERYFMEATVRLHREAEGLPYQGLKPEIEPSKDIQIAEKALETGDVKPVISYLNRATAEKTEDLFSEAVKANKNKENSLEQGRKWADAYVRYIIFVHGLDRTISSGPAHGVGESNH